MQNLFTELINFISRKQQDKHLTELLKGGSIAFTFRIIGGILGYIYILLITRTLGADAMGVYALFLTVICIFAVVGKLGFHSAILRFVAEYSSQERNDLIKYVYLKALSIVVPFSIFLSILLFFSAPYISLYVFNKEYLTLYFKISAFAILPMVLMLINAESLRGLKKIKEYSFLANISTYLFASIVFLILLFHSRNESVPIISYVIGLNITFSISMVLWIKNINFKSFDQKNDVKLKSLLNVSLPMFFTSSMILIMGWTDTLMLGMFKTKTDVGIYNVAIRIAGITSIGLTAINSIAAPKFAEFYGKGDISGLGKISQQSTKIIFWTSFPILLILFIFPSNILGIFGIEFKSGVYALLFLILGQFVNSTTGSVDYILQMTGKHNTLQKVMFFSVVVNVILNALLIPRYGINGAAVSTMISMTILNLIHFFFVKKYYGFYTFTINSLKLFKKNHH